MPEFRSSSSTQDDAQGLFSPAEVEELMRVEFARAARHGHPVVCFAIGVDRLGQLQDLYGYDSKEEILRAVVGVLRAETRDSDILCLRHDDRLVALFPHTVPERGGFLAKRILAAMKKQRFERAGRVLRITLSIGVAHNRHKSAISFETLVRVADEGLIVADQGGGDRFVETELYQLFEQQRRQKTLDEERRQLFDGLLAALPRAAPAPAAGGPAGDKLGETLLEILKSLGIQAGSLEGLDRAAIARAISSMADAKSHAAHGELSEARRTIDHLERRINKLSHALGVTEEELARIASMKNVELGVASIYRGVQGLSDDSAEKARKREMMKTIFHANFELKKRLSDAPVH